MGALSPRTGVLLRERQRELKTQMRDHMTSEAETAGTGPYEKEHLDPRRDKAGRTLVP